MEIVKASQVRCIRMALGQLQMEESRESGSGVMSIPWADLMYFVLYLMHFLLGQ